MNPEYLKFIKDNPQMDDSLKEKLNYKKQKLLYNFTQSINNPKWWHNFKWWRTKYPNGKDNPIYKLYFWSHKEYYDMQTRIYLCEGGTKYDEKHCVKEITIKYYYSPWYKKIFMYIFDKIPRNNILPASVRPSLVKFWEYKKFNIKTL